MLPENRLVPYEPSALPPGPWLVLAPHPDDESIGMGGTLALGAERGLPVKIVMVTDGEIGADPFQRRQEALCACRVLGLEAPEFWNLPDREVYRHLDALAEKLKKIKVHKFRAIFLPSFFEFHPDHRAVTLGALAFLRLEAWLGEVWLYEISRQGEVNRLIVIDEVAERKDRAIDCYQSQLAQVPYRELAASLDCLRAYSLSPQGVRRAEGFWAARLSALPDEWFRRLREYFE